MQLQLVRKNPVVLVVDDDEEMLSYLKRRLYSYNVVPCKTIEDALDAFRKIAPDVAITELNLLDRKGKKLVGEGMRLVEYFRTIDELVSRMILTEHPSVETSTEGYSLGIGAYLKKSDLNKLDQLEVTLERLVRETKQKRDNFLESFGKLFDRLQSERNINFERRDPTYPVELYTHIKSDMEFCRWLKKVHDRFPYEGGFIFTRDSRGGVVPTEPIDLEREYPQNFRAFIIRKYDSVTDVATANDNWRKSKVAGIRHTCPLLFYRDMDGVRSLTRFVFGPNLAETFNLLRQDPDEERTSRYKDAIVSVNNEILLKWRELHRKSVRTAHINKTQNGYLANMRAALDYLRRKTTPQFTDSELEEFIYSFAGMKDIAPYDKDANRIFFSRLMDNAEENSRLDLGVIRPPLEKFYKKLEEEYPYAPDELQDIIRRQYFLVDTDTSRKMGHIFEDLVHSNHAPGAGLSAEQIILKFSDFVTEKFEGKDFDTSKLWMAYAIVGLYKSIRKQNRVLEVYAEGNKESLLKKYLIGKEDYDELFQDYRMKIIHWGKEARWFAALGHLVAANFMEGQSTFASLERLVRSTDIEGYMKKLNEIPAPKLTEKSIDVERMLVAYKFCDRYIIPQSIVL